MRYDGYKEGEVVFGYVRMYKPELKIREYEQYRGVYCSLCKTMGKRYGTLLRMTLSYDITLLAILSMGLGTECVGFHSSHCSYNPMKKCLQCHAQGTLDFCADVAALLAYYRALDNLQDEGFWGSLKTRLAFPFLKRYYCKAREHLPQLDTEIAEMMGAQSTLEQQKTASLDAAAEPFAMLLQKLCVGLSDETQQQTVLARLGYCLGRYIYLADAAEDMVEDSQRTRYNPFLLARRVNVNDASSLADCQKYAGDVLRHCQAECIVAFNLLNIQHFDGILHNILEVGITNVIDHLFDTKSKKKRNKNA